MTGMNVTMPDGTTVTDVPEGTTREQLMDKLHARTAEAASAPAPAPPTPRQQFEKSPAGKLTSAVGGALDAGASMAAGTATDIMGGLSGTGTVIGNALGITHADPVSNIRWWQEKAYQPRTEVGKEITGAIAKVSDKTVGALSRYEGEGLYRATGDPLMATLAELMPDAVLTISGAKAPTFIKDAAARGAAQLAKDAVFNTTKDTAARAARQAHLMVSPTEHGGVIGRTIAGASGKAESERMISAKNQERVAELAKLNMGIPETAPLDRGSFMAARAAASQPYSEARSLGRMQFDQQFGQDVMRAGSKFEQVASDFPESDLASLDTAIKQEKGTYFVEGWDANSAVDQMTFLREQASDLLRSEKASERKLGMVKRDIAAAFEDRLWRHANEVGKPDLASQFQQARKKLAQIHVYQDSTNFDTGHISARQIVAQRKMVAGNVDPFSDELKLIADSAGAFPKSFQDLDAKGRYGPISVFERYALIGGVIEAAQGNYATAAIIGSYAAGAVGRAGVASRAGQRLMRRGSSTAGPIRRAAMKADQPALQSAGAIAGAESGKQ